MGGFNLACAHGALTESGRKNKQEEDAKYRANQNPFHGAKIKPFWAKST